MIFSSEDFSDVRVIFADILIIARWRLCIARNVLKRNFVNKLFLKPSPMIFQRAVYSLRLANKN